MNKQQINFQSRGPSLASSVSQQRRNLSQSSSMTTSTATISNTSSRRTPSQNQKVFEKTKNMSTEETKTQPDGVTSRRPKRTLKLTASQRERKRAIDREAQRSIRLKTKNYIAHLENLVKIMENGGSAANSNDNVQQPHGQPIDDSNDRASVILSRLRESEEEVRRLSEMLSGVQKLTSGTANMPFSGLQDHFENSASVYSHSSDSSGYQPFDNPRTAEAFAPGFTSTSASQPYTLHQQDLYNNFGRFSAPVKKADAPTSEPIDVPKSREEGGLFFLSQQEVNRLLAGGHQSFANQPFDEDIIVRAVLHGWRDVQDEYLLDKGWQALRSIDQSSFRECGVVERMALLYLMRLKLLHQSNTNPQYLAPLPPFFQRSSLEDPEVLKKTPIIEHFIWPGFRSCLCKNPEKYLNSTFADSFGQSLKFLWPHDISDVYHRDDSTQLYSISQGFKQRHWDLPSWTMRRDFFKNANELIDVIPVYDPPMKRALIPAGSSSMQIASNSGRASQKMHRQTPVPKVEVTGVGTPTPRFYNSEPTTATEISAAPIPYSAEVEAWLGDPDMVHWNMAPTMNVGYPAALPHWTNVQR